MLAFSLLFGSGFEGCALHAKRDAAIAMLARITLLTLTFSCRVESSTITMIV